MCNLDNKITFTFNKQKTIEAVLYFTNARTDLSVMHLLKFLFYADMYHLNKYARPVIGDLYYAMENGPVASNAYNMLKKSSEDYELKPIPCTKIKIVRAKRKTNLDYFSDTDIEAFNHVLETYKDYSAEQMSNETYKTYAWRHAWGKKSFFQKHSEMIYEDFLENKDLQKLEYLKENSSLMVF